MGRKLGVERLCAALATGRDDLGGSFGGLVDVGAREVQLDGGDVVAAELHARLCILARGKATYRNPDWSAELDQPRKHTRDESFASRVRETDRVQHPGRGLRDPHGLVSPP